MFMPYPTRDRSALKILRVLFALIAFLPVAALGDPLPPVSPYATALPVVAKHGMVVTQNATASRVGLEVLRRGGNAVDAAVAVGFALAVTLPRAGNIGGGGFMLVHLASDGKTTAIDYRETAPAATTKDVFLDANGEADPFKSRFSGLAVGVPGTVAGLELAWRKYGSGRFTFAELVAPAIALARQGLTVDQDLADSLPSAQPMLARHPSSRAHLSEAGRLRRRGRRPYRARRSGRDARNHRARRARRASTKAPSREKIADAVQAAGGRMTTADLANYRAVERDAGAAGPIAATRSSRCRRRPRAARMSSRSSTFSKAIRSREWGLNSAATIHAMAEAEKLAYADREAWLGDPDFVKVPLKGLVSKAYADSLRATISPGQGASGGRHPPRRAAALRERPDDAFFDRRRRWERGVEHLYAELLLWLGPRRRRRPACCSTTNSTISPPSRARRTPMASWAATPMRRAPRKRPLSSMSPTLVLDGQATLELVTGSPGGSRIITTVVADRART